MKASIATFGNPMQVFFEGGTIPFLAMMQEKFPNADFLVTGSLPKGPEEMPTDPMKSCTFLLQKP